MQHHYKWYEIALAYIRKHLGIVSPSAFFSSGGKYRYEYDIIMMKKANKTKVYRERKGFE